MIVLDRGRTRQGRLAGGLVLLVALLMLAVLLGIALGARPLSFSTVRVLTTWWCTSCVCRGHWPEFLPGPHWACPERSSRSPRATHSPIPAYWASTRVPRSLWCWASAHWASPR